MIPDNTKMDVTCITQIPSPHSSHDDTTHMHLFHIFSEHDNTRLQRMLHVMECIVHSDFLTNDLLLTRAGIDYTCETFPDFLADYYTLKSHGHIFEQNIDDIASQLANKCSYDDAAVEDLNRQLNSQQHPSKYSQQERFVMMGSNILLPEADTNPDYNTIHFPKNKDVNEPMD